MEISNQVIVKSEPICESQSISETKKVLAMIVKEEPIDNEMPTSKEIEVKAGEKFSATKE